jgi:aryl-alcohol dehydrogenase-like predicted oxidoreductase
MAEQTKADLGRRGFLGASLATAAGAVATTDAALAPAAPRTLSSMPTRNLGKTSHRVGIWSLGCQAAVEIAGNEELAEKIIHRAIDLGVNYLDTAAAYGGGVSETNVGRVMRTRRKEVFLATKTNKYTYDEAMGLLDQSLKRLQTDQIDLWQLHNVQRREQIDAIFAKGGALEALQKAREQKIVRFLGVTGHYEPLILAEAIERFAFDTILMAVNGADTHYLSFIRYLLPLAQKKGMGIIGMKVATRGRVLSTWEPPPLEAQPERLRTAKRGTLTMKEALGYNLSLPVSTTIVGCDTVEHVEENVRIASEFTPLCPEEMEAIERKTLPIVRQALYFRRWDLGA